MENADESVYTCVCVSELVHAYVCACMDVGGASIGCQCLKDKMHLVRCCVCSLCAAEESFSKCRLAVLVFTMSLQLQRPFNLKTSQFESPSNIWPAFLLWLNDWMHPHRFLLTSSPIWNLVPVRGVPRTHTHTRGTHTAHTNTHTSKAEITKAFVCVLRAEERPGND